MIDRSIEEGLGEQDPQEDPFKFKDQPCGWTPASETSPALEISFGVESEEEELDEEKS